METAGHFQALALEGQLFQRSGRLISLSTQNLLDCSGPMGVMVDTWMMPLPGLKVMDS